MRYYGNKSKLLPFIKMVCNADAFPQGTSFVDLFAGTNSVGIDFKKSGFRVIANDIMEYSYSIAKSYIELTQEPEFHILKGQLGCTTIQQILDFLNTNTDYTPGFISQNYCPDGGRMYFSNENGLKIDTIRMLIHNWRAENVITESEYYYLLTSLLEAVNLVSNVSGTYAAFLKNWDNRALKPLILKPLSLVDGIAGEVYKQDANELVRHLNADILYLDPPYNSRQYHSNYFILELIASGWFNETPQISGVCGMCDYQHLKSDYGISKKAYRSLNDLITEVNNVGMILLSYNNEGILSKDDITNILSRKGHVEIYEQPHKRYRSVNQTEQSPKQTIEYLFKTTL